MSNTVAEIETKVRALSPDEKADLIRSLVAEFADHRIDTDRFVAGHAGR